MFANNQASLVGNLGRDPEIRYFESGKSLAQFSIAVSTGRDKPADWFDIECWNQSAQRAMERLSKGSRVVVTGSLRQERWQDKQSGGQRSKVVLNAESIEVIERAPQQAVQQQSQQLAAPEYADETSPTSCYTSCISRLWLKLWHCCKLGSFMALSADQKQRIFDLLAAGKTAAEAAEAVGCSRATVQRLKREAKNDPLLKIAKGVAATKRLSEEGHEVIETLSTFRETEPMIQASLLAMFEGLAGMFQQVLAQTSPEDISPRQLPALAKAAADLANTYADFTDRIHGLTVLADEIEKINETRSE